MELRLARLSPLRLWIQSTSLLVVIAGYGVLLLANQGVAGLRREAAHHQLVSQLVGGIQSQVMRSSQFETWQRGSFLPGLELQRIPGKPVSQPETSLQRSRPDSPRLERRSDGAWMVSHVVVPLADGNSLQLLVRQDMTTSVEQEELAFWWLVVVAGLSVLITSALLRRVLRRGLATPLEEFTAQLQAFQAPPTAEDVINVLEQPEELQPIALAFNHLQSRLLDSWKRQRSFVDGVAHELRTPITLISGHAQSLMRHQSHQSTTTLALIRDEAERMGSLVRDLLDLARRDSGRLSLRCVAVAGDDLLLALYERMTPKAGQRLRIESSAAGDQQAPLGLGDPDRLQQCLTTLVDNALLYSPAGTPVTVSYSTNEQRELVLHVRDHGPGVAAEERERIFERFIRGSAGLASETRGSGIGLSVVKLLMDAMGGRALVTDPEDGAGGAEFQLRLPGLNP